MAANEREQKKIKRFAETLMESFFLERFSQIHGVICYDLIAPAISCHASTRPHNVRAMYLSRRGVVAAKCLAGGAVGAVEWRFG